MHYQTLTTLLLALLPLTLAIPQPQGAPADHSFTLHHGSHVSGIPFPTGSFSEHHHFPTGTGGFAFPTGTGEYHHKPTGYYSGGFETKTKTL